jgi:hypothetical protein
MTSSSNTEPGPFRYDPSLLSECALTSSLRTRSDNEKPESSAAEEWHKEKACWILFQLHANYYGKTLPNLTTPQTTPADPWILLSQPSSSKLGFPGLHPHEERELRQRYWSFVDSATLVYQHNIARQDRRLLQRVERIRTLPNPYPYPNYELELNQFADGSAPLGSSRMEFNLQDFFQLWDDLEESRKTAATHQDPKTTVHPRLDGRGLLEGVQFTPLLSADSIIGWASHHDHYYSRLRSKSPTKNTQNNHKQENGELGTKVNLPTEGNSKRLEPFVVSPSLADDMDGTEVDVKMSYKNPKNSKKRDGNAAHLHKREHAGSHTEEGDGDDDIFFLHSLNWATTNNPDGVPLVHSVFDQVCRSLSDRAPQQGSFQVASISSVVGACHGAFWVLVLSCFCTYACPYKTTSRGLVGRVGPMLLLGHSKRVQLATKQILPTTTTWRSI